MPKKKILIIDDEATSRKLISHTLEGAGYECCLAEDGVIGIQRANEFQPDLIICDVMMPNMNGHQVLREIQKNGDLIHVPFVFLSANCTAEDIRKGMNLGADDYLSKPMKPDDLLQTVASRLKRKAILQGIRDQEDQEKEKRLIQDAVTGLRFFMPILNKVESELQGKNFGILLIKIDQFRDVNHAFGPIGGDLVLKEVSNRIGKVIKHTKLFFRADSGSFVILFDAVAPEKEIETYSAHIRSSMMASISYNAHDLYLTLSMGMSVRVDQDKKLKEVLDEAQLALRNVRLGGGNSVALFDQSMREALLDGFTIESGLRQAIKNQEFVAYYQPKIDIKSERTVGFEALMRWQHPNFGIIPPVQFIPVAERSGYIVDMGAWILKDAAKQAVEWNKGRKHKFSMAVNVSGRQMEQAQFVKTVREVLEETKIQPQLLTLEITEGLLIRDVKEMIHRLKELKDLGVLVAIDDFGTGYSSLKYLKDFPVDILKIDRSFIQGLNTESGRRIVEMVLDMARKLKLKVVAEGVETSEQLEQLRKLKCESCQGFYFSKPLPANEIDKTF